MKERIKLNATPVNVSSVFLQTAVMFGGRTEKIINPVKMPGVRITWYPELTVFKLEKEGFPDHWMPIVNAIHWEQSDKQDQVYYKV